MKKPENKSKHTIFYWERYGEHGLTVFTGYGIMDSSGKIIAETPTREAAENAVKLLTH